MLRGTVIGLGRMGLTHFSILNTHPEVEFVAVCDSSSFVLKNVVQHLDVETYKDMYKMLRDVRPDFAIVATPTAMHAKAVRCAVDAGAHVFVEKPFSLNPEQGRELCQLVQNRGLVHQVGYVIRFSDIFMEVKYLLDAGAIGHVMTFKVEMNGPTVLHGAKGSWRSKKRQGGGCLYDFASHSVDLVNYLIGPPSRVTGSALGSIYSNDVEDMVKSTFLYEDGTQGTLLANWSDASYRKPSCHFEALGRHGKIMANPYSYKVFFQDDPKREGFSKGWNQRYFPSVVKPVRFFVRGFEFTRQLDHFIERILEGEPSEVCSFEDGLDTDIIIDRIRQDGDNGGHAHG